MHQYSSFEEQNKCYVWPKFKFKRHTHAQTTYIKILINKYRLMNWKLNWVRSTYFKKNYPLNYILETAFECIGGFYSVVEKTTAGFNSKGSVLHLQYRYGANAINHLQHSNLWKCYLKVSLRLQIDLGEHLQILNKVIMFLNLVFFTYLSTQTFELIFRSTRHWQKVPLVSTFKHAS